MFEGFTSEIIDLGDITIFLRRKGNGKPLLLLHGFPQTHVMWHATAPALSDAFAVICADLRGYGLSGKPASSPEHEPYSKRVMAADMVRMMHDLGYPRFAVAGHDRGARVAYRMALDHPDQVEALAVLDIVPTSEVFDRADSRLALAFWPWSLLAQPAPLPERLILAAPEAVIDDALSSWGTDASAFPIEARNAYVEALSDPAAVHAICEEYRAAASIDTTLDRIDRENGKLIVCPTLVLWSQGSGVETWYERDGGPLAIWRQWARSVSGGPIAGGHFFPEERPAETIRQLHEFFGATKLAV